ncbi:MAG: CHAT domain-containing protein [Lewinellaceae bacterium]|nr:CHAT domain-containing protein [Lewinellaceae bacterium]
MKNTKKVYFSPSGLLYRINLNAIPLDEEFSLSDKFNLIQLTSTRQLVEPTTIDATAPYATLFGGIQYEVDTTTAIYTSATTSNDAIASRSASDKENEVGKSRGGSWNYLKWTKTEVESISGVLNASGFNTTVLTGYDASEEVFHNLGKYSASPRVLHIATHGFFFPDPSKTPLSGSVPGEPEPIFKISDNPMIRSGLILADGNQAWQNKPLPGSEEDGILTAYEISQMNIPTTELVVLSACETGLGDIEGNEGVYGLQRAFKIAGAKYLIISLWQVPDRETKEFMLTFYRHWLNDNLPIPAAFNKTQHEMKERFFNPYQWAGFILVE